MKIFKNKIILSIWFASLMILMILYYFIPPIIERSIKLMVLDSSERMVQQVKLTRTYYLNNIVNNIKESSSEFDFVVKHQGETKKLPLPSTLIHDLGNLFTEEMGVEFRTYSNFPFKNRENRVLSIEDKNVLEQIEYSQNGIYSYETFNKNQRVLKVAIADYMKPSCVNCHNDHPQKEWGGYKWKEGDIRGVIEVTTPITKPMNEVSYIKKSIVFSIGTLIVILIIYYSYLFLKREDQLLEMNKILDERVALEVMKNKEKEQILIQRSKLSSMGEMLNSIAHQWRQPLSELSVILMNIDMHFQGNKLSPTFMKNKMDKSEKLLEYLSYTIDDFRDFFNAKREKSHFNLNKTISSTLNIANMNTMSEIEVLVEMDKGIIVYGLQTELSQVLLNILLNAKEAFEIKNISNRQIKINVEENETYIKILIRDNAGGIVAEVIPMIFDLYYTNKEKGSGIGLYMSKLIVEKHFSGILSVENIENGSLFLISIPLHNDLNFT